MVVSGVNDGANLGDDVLYSGTVAAAMEGRFLGLPTLAVSLCTSQTSGRHFATGARVARMLVGQMLEHPLERAMILNVNVPDLPFGQLRGLRTTRLGKRHPAEPVIEARDQRNRVVYWIGPAGAGADAGEGTDFHAVAQGFVSVTPLLIDLTRYSRTGYRPGLAGPGQADAMIDVRMSGIGMTSARTRDRLVQRLRDQGITDPVVLDRIRNVPRHIFVDEALGHPRLRGHGAAHRLRPDHLPALHRRAHDRSAAGGRPAVEGAGSGHGLWLSDCGARAAGRPSSTASNASSPCICAPSCAWMNWSLRNVRLKHGDGTLGWKSLAPFDGILVAAAPIPVPEALLKQLQVGGRLIVPVGAEGHQELVRFTRKENRIERQSLGSVAFVPLLAGPLARGKFYGC